MSEQRKTLTLKEASKRLGVHPNTLRNWEQQGVIRLIRDKSSLAVLTPAEYLE